MAQNKVWFTSDHHFFHANIIKYCDRPYLGVAQMNDDLIKRHNALVDWDDTVYFIGDFSLAPFARRQAVFRSLSGNKKFSIQGNHDTSITKLIQVGFSGAYKNLWLPGLNVIMIHNPRYLFTLHKDGLSLADKYPDAIFITGHKHNNMPKVYELNGIRIVNVSVDVWDYEPASYEQIMEEWRNADGQT